MKAFFKVFPTVLVLSGIAGWAVARAQFTARVEARTRAEAEALRLKSARYARQFVDLLAGADHVVISHRPANGGILKLNQDPAWVSRLAQILAHADYATQTPAALWVSDTSITCFRGSESVLSLMPIGHVWRISAGQKTADFVVNAADGAAMDALLREALPGPSSS